jgi:hypothetical protein
MTFLGLLFVFGLALGMGYFINRGSELAGQRDNLVRILNAVITESEDDGWTGKFSPSLLKELHQHEVFDDADLFEDEDVE